ncbi:transposase [Falsiroseomonas sp. HC035]|uniref:transposase n=1 Tax=Falsiroseomonas sp. HC035 TaxID=3390999 RepID=UPI003D322426
MMGERPVRQKALFYGFSLEEHVPSDHLLRAIDRFVELSDIRRQLKPFYSATGRPSADPELMIRMLLIGYCCGIRSERRLCEEVHLNLCRVPNHSTFSKNRHGRFRDSDLLRQLFEATVRRCMAEGIVGGQGFVVDASMIRADASRQKGAASAADLNPEGASRTVGEYLAVLDDAAFGAATEVPPKFVSPTDPAARWTAAAGGLAYYAYCDNCLIDVEASTAVRQAEVGAAQTMLVRTAETFGLWPGRLIADTGYGSAAMLGWLADEQGIEPHIPVFDKSQRTDGTFSRSDFIYDHRRDLYICPGGKELLHYRRQFVRPRLGVDAEGLMRYRATKHDCGGCALKPRCCPNHPARKLPRSIHEGARDMARDIARTEEYAVSRRQRKKVEMLFAHLKRILGLSRLRLRGPNGARDEFHLAAAAQNLRKLAKLLPLPTPAPAG